MRITFTYSTRQDSGENPVRWTVMMPKNNEYLDNIWATQSHLPFQQPYEVGTIFVPYFSRWGNRGLERWGHLFKVTGRKWQSWIQAQVSQLPAPWIFTLHRSDVWCGPEQEEGQEEPWENRQLVGSSRLAQGDQLGALWPPRGVG